MGRLVSPQPNLPPGSNITLLPISDAIQQIRTNWLLFLDNWSGGAESRTWAWDQLKYNGFPVLWTPKQTSKMPLYDVISKKKGLH